MVRHESAEALGGIGNDEALEILRHYLNKKEARIVRESCEVALDAAEYWKQFENRSG
jgi:deoxyhypusine monooxygenase